MSNLDVMGFDIFRRKKELDIPEALAKVYKLFFPEGREQQKYLTSRPLKSVDKREVIHP